jgi:sulfonate transport system substrate-binding protein
MKRLAHALLLPFLGAILLGFVGPSLICFSALADANTVRFGYNKLWPAFPLNVAIAKKTFEQYGIDTKWINFQTPNDILLAMTAGELDLGILAGPNLASAHQQGVKVKGIALLAGVGDPPNMLFARKDMNVRSAQDLKGKTIGVNNYGGNFDLYLRRQLVDNGIDPKKDVRIVEIPVFQIIGAITTHTIDAGFVDTIFAAAALKNNSNELTPVFSYRDVAPFKTGYNGLILAANDSFVARNRAAVINLLRGYLEAVRFMHDNPREAVKLYVETSGNKIALLLDKGIDVPPDGQILMPQMQADIDLMAQFGYIKTGFDAAKVVDRSLLDDAAKLN